MTTTDGCHDRAACSGSYLDGELDGPQLIDIGEHVAVCEPCREQTQLLRAMRGSLNRRKKNCVRSFRPIITSGRTSWFEGARVAGWPAAPSRRPSAFRREATCSYNAWLRPSRRAATEDR